MVVVMLLAQCVLLVGYFADKSWKRKLPHDDTGEAAKVSIARMQLHAASVIVCFAALGHRVAPLA